MEYGQILHAMGIGKYCSEYMKYVFIILVPVIITSVRVVLTLHIPMVGFWWRVAAVQSEDQYTSHHYNSKCCYSGCSMCSDPVLGRGSVSHEGFLEGAPVTKVCHPLSHKCCGRRKVQYIFHRKDGAAVIFHILLLLSGDVETNPGPGT